MPKLKAYTDDKCPTCSAQLFSTVPPWEKPKGKKLVVDTCLTHGKVR